MYALCVSGAVNTQGFVWNLYAPYIDFHSFIHAFLLAANTDRAVTKKSLFCLCSCCWFGLLCFGSFFCVMGCILQNVLINLCPLLGKDPLGLI